MAETHELGGSTIVVDRATPKATYKHHILVYFLREDKFPIAIRKLKIN